MLTDTEWYWLMLIDADWCWLMLSYLLTQWMMLIDMLTDADLNADWCWLMVKKVHSSFFCWSVPPELFRSFIKQKCIYHLQLLHPMLHSYWKIPRAYNCVLRKDTLHVNGVWKCEKSSIFIWNCACKWKLQMWNLFFRIPCICGYCNRGSKMFALQNAN